MKRFDLGFLAHDCIANQVVIRHGHAGMNGHAVAPNEALASPAVQALIVELLPSAIPHLRAALIQTHEQQLQKARLEPYKGDHHPLHKMHPLTYFDMRELPN